MRASRFSWIQSVLSVILYTTFLHSFIKKKRERERGPKRGEPCPAHPDMWLSLRRSSSGCLFTRATINKELFCSCVPGIWLFTELPGTGLALQSSQQQTSYQEGTGAASSLEWRFPTPTAHSHVPSAVRNAAGAVALGCSSPSSKRL